MMHHPHKKLRLTMKLDQPWAKTEPTGAICSLILHCHHVAVMARQLIATPVLCRRLASAFETDLVNAHIDRLAILAGLHDLGKALKGFQDKLEGTTLSSRGHVAEALAVFVTNADTKDATRVRTISEWFDNPTDALYVAICHHGEPVGDDRIRAHLSVVSELLSRTRYGHEPIAEITKLSDFLIARFPAAQQAGKKIKFTPAAQHLFAGILRPPIGWRPASLSSPVNPTRSRLTFSAGPYGATGTAVRAPIKSLPAVIRDRLRAECYNCRSMSSLQSSKRPRAREKPRLP
jgi:CRISPR-associated endonuclease Cas3-HD